MIGSSLDVQEKISEYAENKGIRIAFNPGKYIGLENVKIRKIIGRAEVLIVNREEAEFFVGKRDLFRKLHALGPRIVCITNGKEGGEVSDGEKIYRFVPHKIKVVESTGAGDAFGSGFISALIKTGDVRTATCAGLLNAEAVIQGRGAKKGLLGWKEMQRQLKDNPVNIVEVS